jgi:hypothetical protein
LSPPIRADDVVFRTKPQVALEQVLAARAVASDADVVVAGVATQGKRADINASARRLLLAPG